MQVYELITCVRRAIENARNLISVVQFLINTYVCVINNRNIDKVSLIIVARCIFGGDPDNGFAVRNALFKRMVKHGVQIVYRCFIHYTLIGSATRECNNGRWTTARPSCKGKYPLRFQDVFVILPCSHTKISQLMGWDREFILFSQFDVVDRINCFLAFDPIVKVELIKIVFCLMLLWN